MFCAVTAFAYQLPADEPTVHEPSVTAAVPSSATAHRARASLALSAATIVSAARRVMSAPQLDAVSVTGMAKTAPWQLVLAAPLIAAAPVSVKVTVAPAPTACERPVWSP